MAKCDRCYHRGLCRIRSEQGEPKSDCFLFEDISSVLPMIVPLGSNLWVIKDGQVWRGTLEKVSISKTNGIWLEVTMPPEMPDVVSIEYRPSDFGEIIFKNEEAAINKLTSTN